MEEETETLSQGTPSEGLQKLRLQAAMEEARQGGGGILEVEDRDEGFEKITDAVPEKGVFKLVGGYVEPGEKPELFNEVHLRSMGGHEEDLLGNDAISVVKRMNGIMAACTEKMVSENGKVVTDPQRIAEMIMGMPSGTRTHHLISLRRTTHWRKTKDQYDMVVRCPNRRCNKERNFTIDLSTLETFQPPDPYATSHTLHLEDAGIDVTWRVATGVQDETLTILGQLSEHEVLSYMILVRLVEWGGVDVRLGQSDLIDPNGSKIKLSSRAAKVLNAVKGLTSADREDLREHFLIHEPGIDTELEFECDAPKCRIQYTSQLDVGQKTFFFPSATSRRSKRRSST